MAVRRVIVGVDGSLGSLQALRYAEAEARQRDVPLVPVIAWIPPGGDMAERRHSSPYLRKIWREAAWERLRAAFDDGLGGMPADLRVEPHVERGDTGPVLVDIASQPDDLLVIGTGRRAGLSRLAARLGRPLLPGPRQVPGAGHTAVGADGRDRARAAGLASPSRSAAGQLNSARRAWVPLGTWARPHGSCKAADIGARPRPLTRDVLLLRSLQGARGALSPAVHH